MTFCDACCVSLLCLKPGYTTGISLFAFFAESQEGLALHRKSSDPGASVTSVGRQRVAIMPRVAMH